MFVVVDVSDMRWLDEAHTAFDCVVEFEGQTPSGYTVVNGDVEPHAQEMWANALAGEYGAIAEHVLQPLPVPEEISRRQFYQGLAVAGFITRQEALDALDGVIPPALTAVVDALDDEDDQFDAMSHLKGSSLFMRHHPLVAIFALSQDLSEAEVDDFWRLCAGLM